MIHKKSENSNQFPHKEKPTDEMQQKMYEFHKWQVQYWEKQFTDARDAVKYNSHLLSTAQVSVYRKAKKLASTKVNYYKNRVKEYEELNLI